MQITFIGATHEVTGSCTYIEAAGKRFLVDRGMEQGRDFYENKPIPTPVKQLDFVLLTHAHIDHSGLIPLLAKHGFAGDIHATRASCNLCDIMLRDSAHIQEFEAEWKNRKGKRAGRPPVEPLYTTEDALAAIALFVPHDYDARVEIAPGIEVRFTDAGHLLGSAAIEVWLTEGGVTKKIVFSGDVGNHDQPLIRDPQPVHEADYVVLESTYGDRMHEPPPDYATALAAILQRTFDRGGNVVVPSFAVGRTQELLYFIRQIKQAGMVKGHNGFTVYVDSPLAIEATAIFERNKHDCFDAEAKELIEKGINPIGCPDLKLSVSADESIAINFDAKPKVIISASGMCEAGRIRHHLKHNLWRTQNTILFVGYQANNTLGRALVEGAEKVKLFGEEIEVRAEVTVLAGISGHADMEHLIDWLGNFEPKPTRVFVNHGESAVADSFAAKLGELGYSTYAPYSGAIFDLASDVVEYDARPVAILRGEREADGQPKQRTESASYNRLVDSVARLTELMRKSRGCANRDLSRLADQIDSLCDKW